MKKTLVISLIISTILNLALLIALRPGVFVDSMGVKVYSKLADNAWAEGYDYGSEAATHTALEAINGDDMAIEMFVLNAEQTLNK